MRSMRRRIFTFCAVFSLLLCLCVLAAWARSYSSRDEIALSFASGRGLALGWGRGQIAINYNLGTSIKPLPGNEGLRWSSAAPAPIVAPYEDPDSFFHAHRDGRGMVVVPCWSAALLTFIAASITAVPAVRRRRRSAPDHCAV